MTTILMRVRSLLGYLFAWRGTTRAERLDEEIAFHVDMQTARNIERGMPSDEARRSAALSFSRGSNWRDAARDEYRSRPMDDLRNDLRYGARTLRSAPAFTVAAVLTLALGIGANTAIFSAVDGVLLKPLPFSNPDRVVSLFQFDRTKQIRTEVSPANFADWRVRSRAFSGVAAAEPFGVVMAGNEGEEQVGVWNVTQDFFTVLDARPVLGRTLQAADYANAGQPVVVLTYASWQKRFGADPRVVGRTVLLSHKPATIVGVLPSSFTYLDNSHYELFAPKVLDASELALRGAAFYHVVARLAPNVSMASADADLNRVGAQLAAEFPKTNGNTGVQVVRLQDGIVGNAARALLLLLGAVGFVLLIACTNVANLMLARTTRRGREFAIRTALGASRGRIARQILTESALIALAGGACGVLLARWGVGAIRAFSPANLPRVEQIHLDYRALLFTLTAVVIAALLFGLAPALRAAAPGVDDELKGGGRSTGGVQRRALRGTLVSVEVALAVILLVGAGLLVRSFVAVVQSDRGYRSDHVLSATLFVWQWNRTPGDRARFVARLVERASMLPGVSAAGATSSLPLSGTIGADHASFTIVGRPVNAGQEPAERVTSLTPNAFAVLGIAMRRGRLFALTDDSSSARVAIVSESMARRYWPNEDAIGKRIRVGFYDAPVEREIVGIVNDIRQTALDAPPEPTIYLPHAQAATGAISLIVRTAVAPSSLQKPIKEMVTELNPRLPVAGMFALDDAIDASLKPRRFTLGLFGCFAGAALLLAVVGVYGVISHTAAERTREFGVRIALGAQAGDIVSLVLRQGLAAAVVGLCVGLAASAVLTRTIASMLFGVERFDPLTYGGVAGVMLVTAVAACLIPAARATRVDPLRAMRVG